MTNRSSIGASSSGRSVMIVLSYLWILAVVPLLVEKQNSDIQWHAKHGLVLLLAELIFWIAFSIVTVVFGSITFGLGYLVSLFGPFLWLAIVVVHVLAIVKGLNGRRLLIPGVSDYASRV